MKVQYCNNWVLGLPTSNSRAIARELGVGNSSTRNARIARIARIGRNPIIDFPNPIFAIIGFQSQLLQSKSNPSRPDFLDSDCSDCPPPPPLPFPFRPLRETDPRPQGGKGTPDPRGGKGPQTPGGETDPRPQGGKGTPDPRGGKGTPKGGERDPRPQGGGGRGKGGRGKGGGGGRGRGGRKGKGRGGGAIRAIRVARIADPQFSSYSSRIGGRKKKSIIDSDCPDWKARLGLLGLQFLTFKSNIAIRVARIARIARIAKLTLKVNYCKNWVSKVNYCNPSNPSNPSRPQIFATNQKIGRTSWKRAFLFSAPILGMHQTLVEKRSEKITCQQLSGPPNGKRQSRLRSRNL